MLLEATEFVVIWYGKCSSFPLSFCYFYYTLLCLILFYTIYEALFMLVHYFYFCSSDSTISNDLSSSSLTFSSASKNQLVSLQVSFPFQSWYFSPLALPLVSLKKNLFVNSPIWLIVVIILCLNALNMDYICSLNMFRIMHRLMMRMNSEKCVIRQFNSSMTIIEHN